MGASQFMTDLQFREARSQDMETIFLMGFDTWRNGLNREQYLAVCQESPKYLSGKWYVLENAEKKLLSSLIIYPLAKGVRGIGSIATEHSYRKKGYGSELVRQAVAFLEAQGTQAIFLFSDIDPTFYEKLGFGVVNQNIPGHPHTVCMVRPNEIRGMFGEGGFALPSYF